MRHLSNDYAPPSDGFLDGAQQWADGKIHGAYKSAFKGMLHVAASGFGKGVIATAIIAAGVMAAFAFTAAPNIAAGQVFSEVFSTAVKYFTQPTGLAILAGGGLAGAAISAHGEGKRLNKAQAEDMSKYYAAIREKSAHALEKSPEKTADIDLTPTPLSAHHTHKISQTRAHNQQVAR